MAKEPDIKDSELTDESERQESRREPQNGRPRRRFRRMLLPTALVFLGSLVIVFAVLFIAFQSGYIDSYIEDQFSTAFDEMGVSMEAEGFTVGVSPFRLSIRNALFKNKETGQRLVGIESADLDLSLLDTFAFSRIRNVHIDRTEISGVDVWVEFDENGKSNFEGIEILPPKNNVRFKYASTKINLRDSRIHVGEQTRDISGYAEDFSFYLEPDAARPKDSEEIGYLYRFGTGEGRFRMGRSEIKPVGIASNGKLHEEGADIEKLEISSPIGRSVLSGKINDWSEFSYELAINSTVDLTQASNTFELGTPITGLGNFKGTVTGKGDDYKVVGQVDSESMAASNVRLKALKVSGKGEGEGSSYRASGRAIAEMLTFEDFRIRFPTLIGTVRGTGVDFKWFGELQAAAVDSPLGTIGSLIISDAVAQYEESNFTADFGRLRAKSFSNDSVLAGGIESGRIKIVRRGSRTEATVPRITAANVDIEGSTLRGIAVDSAKVSIDGNDTTVKAKSIAVNEYDSKDAKVKNARAADVEISSANGTTLIDTPGASAEEIVAGTTRVKGVEASRVQADVVGDTTRVDASAVKIAAVDSESAVLSNLNIAGVRLSVRNGVIEGTTEDFDAGDIDLKENGRLERVSVRKPVFVLEPSGKYRASLDMSLGGGVIGDVTLGDASASVIAENSAVQLRDLKAKVMDGSLDGEAVLALNGQNRSELNADFREIDLAKLLALQGGRMIPVEGKAKGRAELTFAGTDYRRATGTLTAEIVANAGTADRGLIPVTGRVGVTAESGLVEIDYAGLRTEKSELTADGRFDLIGQDSDFSIVLNSSDASEIDRIVRVIDLAPELENRLDAYEVGLAGTLAFNGNVTGDLSSPQINGRASLESVSARDRDLGSLVAEISASFERTTIRDGVLQARDGGNVTFQVDIPSGGSDNIALVARLNDVGLENFGVFLPLESFPEQLRQVEGKATGSLDLRGLPGKMLGTANIQAKNGAVNAQSFENLVAKVSFENKRIGLTSLNAGFGGGSLAIAGFYDIDSTAFDFNAEADQIPAEKILAFFPQSESAPAIDGEITMKGRALGETRDTSTFQINFDGAGNRVSINGSRFGVISFKGETLSNVLNATIRTRISGRDQIINARADFSDESVPFSANTVFDDSSVTPYINILRPEEPGSVVVTGTLTGQVSAAGNLVTRNATGERQFSWRGIEGSANLSAARFLFDDIPLEATEPVIARFSSNGVTFENAKFSGGGSNLVVEGTKAFVDEGMNSLSVAGKINLGIVRAFSRNTLKNVFVSGLADVAIRLTGINRTARLNGTAILEKGSAATFVGPSRIAFENLKGRIRFTTNQVQIEEITAELGRGKVVAQGGALLTDRLALERIRLDIRGTNVTTPLPTDFLTTGDLNIEVSGRLEGDTFGSFVSGTVLAKRSIYRKDIDLADLISGRRDTDLSQSSSGVSSGVTYTAPRLDIRIVGRNALDVRNNLADLKASVDLRLFGDSEVPRLSGRITANSGTLFFRDDRYEVRRGVLTFPPNTTIEPRINLQAEATIRGYQVFVNLSGDLTDEDALNLVATSNPALPQADVASLITTGNLANTGDGIPTVAQGGINTAARIITDEIINRPIARATDKLFGLNRFELDPIITGRQGTASARLTVGRQINRNLLATYSTNLSEDQNQVLALEYRVSNRLSFVAAYEQRSLTNVTQRRNRFRFEIRLRKRF